MTRSALGFDIVELSLMNAKDLIRRPDRTAFFGVTVRMTAREHLGLSAPRRINIVPSLPRASDGKLHHRALLASFQPGGESCKDRLMQADHFARGLDCKLTIRTPSDLFLPQESR
jgi:hypothetical protein